MRNYSHFVIGGDWIPLSKGDKGRMVECLRSNPELAIIAVSGQKHIVFRATPGWWQIEEQSTLPLDVWSVLDAVECLYTIFSKTEIETGMYSQRRMMDFGINDFLSLEDRLKFQRGTLLFDLAIFLAQKKEESNGGLSAGVPSGATAADPTLAGNRRGVQEKICPQYLGSVREQHAGGGVHKQTEPFRQLNLFETGD
jgi:hypothetical protein